MARQIAFLALFCGSIALTSGLPAQSAVRKLDAMTFINVAREVMPSVANITIAQRDDRVPGSAVDYQRELLDSMRIDGPMLDEISGSGVLIARKDDLGYVVTNNHVVKEMDQNSVITMTFHQRDDKTAEYSQSTTVTGDSVRVIGGDQLSDIAVIEFRIPEELKIKAVEFGDSDKAEIGEMVLAIGNPLNFNHTMTEGIISGKSRYLGSQISLERLIETDAVIQPGNSGGPLVNLDGKIVGITNAIISQNNLWQGKSFAIPSNQVSDIAHQLMENGRVSRGYLGVRMVDLARIPKLIKAYKLTSAQGVLIQSVNPNGPADLAGIDAMDLVMKIDGEPIRSTDHMLQIITAKPVDSDINIDVMRLNEAQEPITLQVSAKLTERPSEPVLQSLFDDEQTRSFLSPDFFDMSKNVMDSMKLSEYSENGVTGLQVDSVVDGSIADTAGLKQGDVIVSVNGRSTLNMEDFLISIAIPTRQYSFVVQRAGAQVNISIGQ